MFSVCSHLGGGGYPYPIMLCNISQNAMGQPGGGGDPARSSRGGGVPGRGGGGVPCGGGTMAGGYPGWRGGGGYPARGGGTQLGQHREYLLHGGRYASCVHAGGLSCSIWHEISSELGTQCICPAIYASQLQTHSAGKYPQSAYYLNVHTLRQMGKKTSLSSNTNIVVN